MEINVVILQKVFETTPQKMRLFLDSQCIFFVWILHCECDVCVLVAMAWGEVIRWLLWGEYDCDHGVTCF